MSSGALKKDARLKLHVTRGSSKPHVVSTFDASQISVYHSETSLGEIKGMFCCTNLAGGIQEKWLTSLTQSQVKTLCKCIKVQRFIFCIFSLYSWQRAITVTESSHILCLGSAGELGFWIRPLNGFCDRVVQIRSKYYQ